MTIVDTNDIGLKQQAMNDYSNAAGWISVYRKIREHWIWDDPVKFQRWIDMLFEVNHTDKKILIGSELADCQRGQSVRSLTGWAKRWKISKSAARRFLQLLEKDNMIILESVSKTTRITVCNYDNYQISRNDNETIMERLRNDNETIADPNNNINNINKNTHTPLKFSFKKALIDYGFKKELVDEWMIIRKSKKAVNSELSFKTFINQIEKSKEDKNKVLEVIVTKQWKGFEAEWLINKKKSNSIHSGAAYIQAKQSHVVDI